MAQAEYSITPAQIEAGSMNLLDLLAAVATFQRLNSEDQQRVLDHLRNGQA